MNSVSAKPVQIPAKTIRERMAENHERAARRAPVTALDTYNRGLLDSNDWIIAEQPSKTLPKKLAD